MEESGDEAFPFLFKLTGTGQRENLSIASGMSCGCSKPAPVAATAEVTVVEKELVAGFHAVVLQADSANAARRLAERSRLCVLAGDRSVGSPPRRRELTITALKVAKESGDETEKVAASPLRISFKTDRPLFPYRKPDFARFGRGPRRPQSPLADLLPCRSPLRRRTHGRRMVRQSRLGQQAQLAGSQADASNF